MTITLAWKRILPSATELIVSSDSRLRSCGALNQAQKIFTLERGDCCLGFCGDAQIAYPLFVQLRTALDNNVKTRTRAEDVSKLKNNLKVLANQLISSWDLPLIDVSRELAETKILIGGWSWKRSKFLIDYIEWKESEFISRDQTISAGHPWGGSLVFLGDYESDYIKCLREILRNKYGPQTMAQPSLNIKFDYEPLEALQLFLDRTRDDVDFDLIGGTSQLAKVYQHGNTLPYAVKNGDNKPVLLGRELLEWEKTELPIIELGDQPPKVHYPMSHIPKAKDICDMDKPE